jgi:hypothetical protein
MEWLNVELRVPLLVLYQDLVRRNDERKPSGIHKSFTGCCMVTVLYSRIISPARLRIPSVKTMFSSRPRPVKVYR